MSNKLLFTKKQKQFFAILVNIIVPLAGISTDIYLPSLPALSHHFSISHAMTQLTITSYVVAMGLSQLIAGPISDAYGRKKLLLIALFTQLIAVLGILYSPTIFWMITFRFIQGFGAALMIVPARAINNDLFTGYELKKKFSYNAMSFALGPIIAPFIGGYLQNYFGWQANFLLIIVYILLLTCLLLFFYRETITTKHTFSVHHLWKNYHFVLSNRYFVISAFFVGVLWGYTSLFNVTGPFIVQTIFQRSAISFGHFALSMGIAWFVGNLFTRILFRFDKKIKTQFALSFILINAITMLLLVNLGYFNVYVFTIPTFFMILITGFIFSTYVADILTIFPKLAASANACLFAMIWLIFSSFTILATQLKIHSLLPLSLTYLAVGLLGLFIYSIMIKLKATSTICMDTPC